MGAALIGALVLTLIVRGGGKLTAGGSSFSSHDPTANQSPINNEVVGPEDGQPIDWPSARVLLIGDSLATPIGLGDRLKRRVAERGGTFKNIAVGGTNILQWSSTRHEEGRALASALADFRPTLVLVCLGTNDEATRKYHGDPRWWTEENLAKNLVGPNFSVAKQRTPDVARLEGKLSGTHRIWIGPPAAHPDKWPMEPAFRELLAESSRPYYFDTEVIAPQKSSDKIHCSGSGYSIWADNIMQYLERVRF
jgi:lysophospholipase L1-like esterase